jgi:EAL domain-containing protein (putative c-di-GMP-specific phosphodiesterase class I)
LILEITESTLMLDIEEIGAKLEELRKLNVRIAIDDFGMGYSSLSYLRRFPIDIMKIDKSFVDGVTRGAEAEALFNAILRLADALEIEAVAEGVEHPEQAERLQQLGCRTAQGFYFSRPVEPEAIALLLKERPGTRRAEREQSRTREHKAATRRSSKPKTVKVAR